MIQILIGVGIANFGRELRQLGLFENPQEPRDAKARRIDTALDAIRGKFGRAAIVRGRLFDFERKRK